MHKMRKISYILAVLSVSFLLDACQSAKHAEGVSDSASVQAKSVDPLVSKYHQENNSSEKSKIKTADNNNKEEVKGNGIKEAYATKLGVSKKDITNYKLYDFIDKWYGTPYKYAGRSKKGVDCSDFVSLLYKSVYDITVSGSVPDIYKLCKPIKRSEIKEGDLVFFKINKRYLSHVGVYLQNHKFVHASVHSGVIIDDLGEDYYKKYFRVAGRILE